LKVSEVVVDRGPGELMLVCVPVMVSVCVPPTALSTLKLTVPRSGEGMAGDPVIVALMTEKFVSEPAQVKDPVPGIQARDTGVSPSKTVKLTVALAGDIEANAAAPASKTAKVSFLIFEPPLAFQVLLLPRT
jgi:hypothetical protein